MKPLNCVVDSPSVLMLAGLHGDCLQRLSPNQQFLLLQIIFEEISWSFPLSRQFDVGGSEDDDETIADCAYYLVRPDVEQSLDLALGLIEAIAALLRVRLATQK